MTTHQFARQLTAALYKAECERYSDINEHLEILYNYASHCDHVTEFGTRHGSSTYAFLYSQPVALHCYDVERLGEVGVFELLAPELEVDFHFHQESTLECTIVETDLLFVDTLHTYDQLKAELTRHANKVQKYIVLHDVVTFGQQGELPGTKGLRPAVDEFLAEGKFKKALSLENNNGLMILKRK